MEALITTQEAARRLSLSPGTLRNWRCRGCGPTFVRIGGAVRYRALDLEAFVASAGAR